MWARPPTVRRGTTESAHRNDGPNHLATSMKNDQRSRGTKTATKQQPKPRSRLGEQSPAALLSATRRVTALESLNLLDILGIRGFTLPPEKRRGWRHAAFTPSFPPESQVALTVNTLRGSRSEEHTSELQSLRHL